mgnify:CR=1 FL=1|tara:strand:- start:7512 stop:7721 length:210 start_codon:yes stop_codon:yes gene_type:complete
MSQEEVDLSGVQAQGLFVVGQIYYIYKRAHDFNPTRKHLSRFSPKESMLGEEFIQAIRYIGDNKFEKTN